MKDVRTVLRTVFIVLLISSCGFSDLEFDKVQNPTVSPEIALHIGSISYTIGDLMEDLEDSTFDVSEGEDLFISLIYRDTTFYSDQDDLIAIDDVVNSEEYSPVSTDIPPTPAAKELNFNKDFEFTISAQNGEEIDSTYFSSGTLEYTISSDFDFPIDYIFTLTDFRESDNQPISYDRTVAANSSDMQSTSMDGNKLISNPSTGENVFVVNLDVTMNVPANTTVESSDKLIIDLVFDDPKIRASFGFFGNEEIDIFEDEISISAFDDLGDGSIEFLSPSLTLEIDNEYGVEMTISMEGIKAINDGVDIPLTGEVVDNPQFVDSPNFNQIGETVSTEIVIGSDNSNIADLFSTLPEKLVFDLVATPNPVGGDNESNFLYDDLEVEIRSIMEIPFEIKMDGFSKEFDFASNANKLDGAESISLLIDTYNEIPFSGTVDVAFLDEDDEELHVLSDIELIQSPDVGTDGRTEEANQSEASIDLENEAIDAFLQSQKVLITLNIFTFENEADTYVKLFSDYELTLDLSVVGKIFIEL